MVTSGSQQGIDLIARVLVSPGDVVLVELPTFTGAIAAFKNMQSQTGGVRQEADGISLEHLDEMWKREAQAGRSIKLLYLVPNFQTRPDPSSASTNALECSSGPSVATCSSSRTTRTGSCTSRRGDRSRDAADARRRQQRPRVVSEHRLEDAGARLPRRLDAGPAMLIERFDTAKQSTDLTSGI